MTSSRSQFSSSPTKKSEHLFEQGFGSSRAPRRHTAAGRWWATATSLGCRQVVKACRAKGRDPKAPHTRQWLEFVVAVV